MEDSLFIRGPSAKDRGSNFNPRKSTCYSQFTLVFLNVDENDDDVDDNNDDTDYDDGDDDDNDNDN